MTERRVARNARAEAQAIVGDEWFARVLEPSPPAVVDGPWFADDPFRVPSDGRPVVRWDEWLVAHPEHRAWAADRWLGARRALAVPPDRLSATRRALHDVARHVVSPARERVNGKIGLRWTLGGFGTPFFGDDQRQVRVDTTAGVVVTQIGDDVTVDAVATDVDPAAGAWLADWYGFAFFVLETFRADPESVEGGRVQLWPEHFDASFECLSADDGRRATYGFSPGDDDVDEPYLYVSLWDADRAPASDLWDAEPFRGALLLASTLTSLPDEASQRTHALTWLRARRDALRR